ncbi:hypothetical protein DVA67_007855 [Solirubrobacter sp. CPCC 204708]|uniref:DUF1080 domain-containing protein n=1 Tax=Solirubrobacter deserti TaxID=2282478 RepID=A0ABT4RSJ5_9ACTN|nr:hypothetical protein [Solirubrobacter deserti]MBE2315885.1 hypothetical protein [Solirubrobacter deserti]MDA0141566.1 hypothetical protein [Solirubrobacter deserti]
MRAHPRRSAVAVIGLALCAAAPETAVAASPWETCSRSAGHAAALKAGLQRALNTDRGLRRVFSGTQPSSIYRRPSTSLCGDFNGDGVTDRALLYQCCTVSSPAPWVVLRRRGSQWRIVFRRLSDTTFRLEANGTRLVTTEPKYGSGDANCCPSQLRIGTLRWTGRSFKRSFRLQDT